MQQVSSVNLEKLPTNGYYVSKEDKKKQYFQNESHIHKQNALTGIKTSAHKLYNDVFTYFPKGFKGSKNSDFYEFLSMGLVPYLIGGATMIATYSAANSAFKPSDAGAAAKVARNSAAGIVLYGLGKVASRKLSRSLINMSTGVNLDLKYLNKAYEVPELGQDKGLVRVQYPGVYDSSEFPRTDLIKKDAELFHDDKNYHDDRIARKMGYKDRLNAPEQIVNKKVRELKVRAGAMENILGYIPAALGVALGAQKSFQNLKIEKVFNFDEAKNLDKVDFKAIKSNLFNPVKTLKNSFVELWQGNGRNLITKNFGKALIIGSVAATLLNWLVPTLAFKKKPDTLKSKIDTKKEYEVC